VEEGGTALTASTTGTVSGRGTGRILAVLEPRSNTMRLGVHNATLAASLSLAHRIFVYAPPDLGWDAPGVFAPLGERATVFSRVEDIVDGIAREARRSDQVLVMSNGGFRGIHERLLAALAAAGPAG
jgi:UDP-N-acetylmuramate: L-alanyl-gamma-D-glutamyl-meso-diaminopimelate ligase